MAVVIRTPKERFEALKARYASTPDNQHQLGDVDLIKIMDRDLYEATKEGDVEKFIGALEEVSESVALPLIFDQVTPSGNSLLHVAASSGKEEVMKLILSHSHDLVAQKNSSEDTPLHVAVRDGRFEATRRLIPLRRDLDIMYWKNKDNKSPLYLAVKNCQHMKWIPREERGPKIPPFVYLDILELLVEEFKGDGAYAVKLQGMSPVFALCKRGNTGMLKEIIGPDRLPKLLHMRDEKWGTPLHFAASVGNRGVVDFLLAECPNLALQTDKDGSYPVHIACEWIEGNDATVVSQLMDGTWSDLAEIKNKKGQNVVHVAAKAGKELAVSWICACCTGDITWKLLNSKDDDGNTPLHLASMHAHCEVLSYLTWDEDVDLRLRNNAGLTALDVAMESRSLSTINSALVGRAILIVAGVPRSEGRDVLSPTEQGSGASKSATKQGSGASKSATEQGSGASKSPAEWIKDQVNTLLLVATLVASVTFTAGIALPGGYNASGDPHPEMATMLHHRMFQVFVIANMLAMYSSILAVVVLLWGLNRDYYVAELAYHSAGPLLLMSLTGMSVAFFAAVTVALSKLTWLGSLVLSVGVLYLVMVVVVLAALIFPSSKTTMRIVVLYYRVVSVPKLVRYFIKNDVVGRLPSFRRRFRRLVRVCKNIVGLRES